MLDLFAELNAQGSTIAIITHDMGVAARTNRVVRLLDGLVVSDGPPPAASSGLQGGGHE